MMNKPYRVLVLFSLAIGLAACKMPAFSNLVSVPTADMTQAYASTSANLTKTPTQPATPLAATATRVLNVTQPVGDSTNARPTATRAALTPTAACNRAAPGNPIDVTIPDNTILAPGKEFTKTWRLENAGSCVWSRAYTAVFFYGDQMQAPIGVQLSGEVPPGQSIDISIDMVAPPTEGNYQSNWMLAAPDGSLFGIGPGGAAPFWVRIQIAEVDTPVPAAQPTATTTPTPVVYVSGLVNLQPGNNLDLDNKTSGNSDNADVIYTTVDEANRLLTPMNGARFGSFGLTAPSYNECLSTNLALEPLTLDSIEQGSFYCARTNDGLPGWVRLVALNEQDGTLTLEILTWSIP